MVSRITLLVALGSLTLAACATPAPVASPTLTPPAPATPAASPHPTPPASPSATASAVLACPPWDDGLDTSGLAPIAANRYAGICTGMSFAQASTTSPLAVTPEDYCPWVSTLVANEDTGFFISAVTEYEHPGENIWMFRMAWWGDPAGMAGAELPTTAEGITVGSTAAEVRAAYPDGSSLTQEDMSLGTREQWVVPITEENGYVFDVTDGYVSIMYWGERLDHGMYAEVCGI